MILINDINVEHKLESTMMNIERDKIYIPNTQIHDHLFSRHLHETLSGSTSFMDTQLMYISYLNVFILRDFSGACRFLIKLF